MDSATRKILNAVDRGEWSRVARLGARAARDEAAWRAKMIEAGDLVTAAETIGVEGLRWTQAVVGLLMWVRS